MDEPATCRVGATLRPARRVSEHPRQGKRNPCQRQVAVRRARWCTRRSASNGPTRLLRTMPVLASTALIACSMRWEIRSNSAGPVTVLIICNRLTIPNSLQGNKYVVDSLRSPVRLLLLEAIDRVVRECDAVYLSIGRGRHGMGRTRVALANQEVSSSPGRRRDDR